MNIKTDREKKKRLIILGITVTLNSREFLNKIHNPLENLHGRGRE